MEGFKIYCPECGGNGFIGNGNEWDSVCDNCSEEGLQFISLNKANKVMIKHGFIHLKANDANDIMNEYVDFATDEYGIEYNFLSSEIQYQDFGIIVNRNVYIVHLESDTVWKNGNLHEPEYEVIEYCKKIIDEVRMCNFVKS